MDSSILKDNCNVDCINSLTIMDSPPINANRVVSKSPRCSNLELYRIICMLMIVAHHYVVNSGIASMDGPIVSSPTTTNSLFLTLFGAWGKTGINCFLMITGYYMCKSRITLRKFFKMICQIYLYKFLIFPILLVSGYETISLSSFANLIMPFWGLTNNFVGCFIVFWLTIPFLNILVHNMTKRQHEFLVLLMLGMYTLLGSIPGFGVAFNYVTWFGIVYFVASYIRLYPNPVFERKRLWAWLTIFSVSFAVISIVIMCYLFGNKGIKYDFFFVSDCNRFFAVAVAVCSFLWFKNMEMKHSKIINAFGAGTFGVLLIHANSNAMRTWLWKDTVDVVGHYALPLWSLVLYSIAIVVTVFIVCNLIDQLRIATLEKWFFRWYDNKIATRLENWINRVI